MNSYLEKAQSRFHYADQFLSLYKAGQPFFDPEPFARLIMDYQACENYYTGRILILPTMIRLRQIQNDLLRNAKYDKSLHSKLQCLEVSLMRWFGKAGKPMTIGDLDDIDIEFSYLHHLLRYCDFSHWPADLAADYTSSDTQAAIQNSCLRGERVFRDYIRKWEFGWQRFFPWKVSK